MIKFSKIYILNSSTGVHAFAKSRLLLGAVGMTISPALLVKIFQTGLEIVNIRSDAKTVIDGVLCTCLEGTGGEASLAACAGGRLDATNRRGGGISW